MASFDGLERMKALLEALGDPEKDLKVLHIAGTNGKGSTAVMTASILEAAGHTVGLYTSPHLEDECERVQIWDGEHHLIDRAEFDALKERVRAAEPDVKQTLHSKGIESNRLTVFEVYTAAAYLYFEEKKPDYVVLETGLGGRLDSTNTIEKPLVTVITQVGLDHTAELGNTIFKIAREKAGIIKAGVPVVSETEDMNVSKILRRTAEEKGCEFIDASVLTGRYKGLSLSMRGEHQFRNAAAAAEAVSAAGIDVPEEAVVSGLEKAYLPGRFEVLGGGDKGPFFIVDGAHNPDAISALIDTFNAFAVTNKIRRTLVIFGCMKDKNSTRMVQYLTGGLRGCSYAAAAVSYDRAESAERIAGLVSSAGRGCIICDDTEDAYRTAMSGNYQCILVTGSIYLAGEMRALYFREH